VSSGSIAKALEEVRARIERACDAAGRDPSSVRLVAVSKTKGADAIREAYAAGQRAFGENYAQELEGKAQALADLPDLEWHFIGHLQTNKAKVVARTAHVVHAVDSLSLAKELGRRVIAAGRGPLPVLLEVNIAAEPQKHGCPPERVGELITAVRAESGLVLHGFMAIPPAGDLETARRVFTDLASLRTQYGGEKALPDLSMGMTHDLEPAIAAGATIVRVGTAIFGAR
jgi:pyridoxal phosphate enzyme (YggS family)